MAIDYCSVITLCDVQLRALQRGRRPNSQSKELGLASSRCYRFEVWAFLFSPRCPSSLICIKEYLAIDGGGNMSNIIAFAPNCCVARMLPREAELVSE